MPDLPKQELDELFREGAGMQQFEYNEAAWNKMEAKLDNDDKNRKIGIWLLLLMGVALATMAGLYYTSLDNTTTSQEEIYAEENTTANSSSAEVEIAQNEQVIEADEIITIASENVAVANENVKESTELKVTSSEKIYSTSSSLVTNANVNTTNSSVAVSSTTTPAISAAESQSNEIVNNTSASTESIISTYDNSASEAISRNSIDIELLPIGDVAFLNVSNHTIQNKQSKIQVTSAEKPSIDNDPLSIVQRLSYTLFAAPEWSSIGVEGPKEMGYKFGAKIGFQLTDKFELSTGLSISQKKFNGEGSEFKITEGWVNNIMPMTMEAKCNVIEIPLDLNYHFNGVGNTGFVAGLGLRSFMLHSEWYGFEYNVSQIGLVEEIVTDNTQNKNWVGSLELSLGYNKKVSDNLSVQVVPYLQIPVTGIGEGKVDLYSGGIQFAARFDGK